MIPGGEARELPDHIALMLIEAHPAKLCDAEAQTEAEIRLADTSSDNRMVDVKPPRAPKKRGGRRTKSR